MPASGSMQKVVSLLERQQIQQCERRIRHACFECCALDCLRGNPFAEKCKAFVDVPASHARRMTAGRISHSDRADQAGVEQVASLLQHLGGRRSATHDLDEAQGLVQCERAQADQPGGGMQLEPERAERLIRHDRHDRRRRPDCMFQPMKRIGTTAGGRRCIDDECSIG